MLAMDSRRNRFRQSLVEAAAVLAEMEGSDAFLEFRDLLTERLAEDPAALSVEDEDLSLAWQDVIDAYFEKLIGTSKGGSRTDPESAPQGEIVVEETVVPVRAVVFYEVERKK